MANSRTLLLSAIALMAAGCSSGPLYCPKCGADLKASPATAAKPSAAQAQLSMPSPVYKIAPSRLFEVAQEALKEKGLVIASAEGGVIRTDWKPYEGELHIVRRWQEQTRYRVSIIPDISDPANASRFEVTEETQRRSNERANWETADQRPARVREITEAIASKVR